MRVLLTGSSGFVGQNLLLYLKKQNYLINQLSLRGSWIDNLPVRYDVVIHLAGIPQDGKNLFHPDIYFKVNTQLTKQIFDEFLNSSARDFIYLSSVKAAADTLSGILTEEISPNPRTPYGQSKLYAEEYLLSKALPDWKRVIILRPCLIHGPENKGNLNMLYKFVRSGFPWPLAAFNNIRSFLSIDNLCFIIEQIVNNADVPSGIYNVADDDPVSTNNLIHLIAEASNFKSRLWKLSPQLIHVLARIGDALYLPMNSEKLKKLTESYVVSNVKIKKCLGLKELPLNAREGLLKTIKSFGNK